jgi:hypothetical protein
MLEATTRVKRVIDLNGREHDIHAWYLLRNGWEYWQTEPVGDDGYTFGYVMGHACEWGSFNLKEMSEYLMSTAKGSDLDDLSPPTDDFGDSWSWKNQEIF